MVLRHFAEHFVVVGKFDDNGDIGVVLGCRADHGRATDVDVLDAILERGAFLGRDLEWIKIHHQQIDRLDVVLLHRRDMLFVTADRQQPTMYLRVKRLDPAVHHLGRAGKFGNIDDLEAGIT